MTEPDTGGGDVEQYERALPRGGRQLPAGRHGFSPEFVARSQRNRMIDAMAHAVAEKGYEATTVADVLERAGVSRRTFYLHFTDKEECFLACYDMVFGALLDEAVRAYESRRRWPDRISAGIETLLVQLAAEPAYARAAIVEVLAAGPAAIARRDAALQAFGRFFDPAGPEVPAHGVAPIVAEATVGGIYEVIYRRIVTEGPGRLPELRGELTYLALAPFLGQATAMRVAGLRPRVKSSPTRTVAAKKPTPATRRRPTSHA